MYADKNLRWRRETARRCVLLCLRPRGEGGSKHCFCSSIRPFVCPSVCPSVSHIPSNSRTPRPNVPKFGRKVPYLRCDSHTSFKVKRSKAGSQGTLMLTRIVHHIFRIARPTNFKLGIQMKDDDPHQPQAPWPPRSQVKVISSHRLYVSSLPLLNSGNKMLYLCH